MPKIFYKIILKCRRDILCLLKICQLMLKFRRYMDKPIGRKTLAVNRIMVHFWRHILIPFMGYLYQ